MVNTERKQVTEAITSLNIEYCTLEGIANQIAELIKLYGEDAVVQYHYPDYCETKYLYVFRKRSETDQEMAKRIQYEADMAVRQEEADRVNYARLKAKFKG